MALHVHSDPILVKGMPEDAGDAMRTGLALFGCCFLIFLFSTVSLYAGRGINAWIFPAAFAVALSVCGYVAGGRLRKNLGWLVVSALLLLLCPGIALLTFDHSYDGIRYHQEIISSLLYGWDPLRQIPGSHPPYSPWALHYAKCVEICEASIVAFTGRIESGKGLNLIMLAASSCVVYAFLRECAGTIFIKGGCASHSSGKGLPLSSGKAVLLTVAVVANPVVMAQLPTFYVDLYKYIYLIFCLYGFYLMTSPERRRVYAGMIVTGMSLVMAMATKFTYFVEAGIWVIVALVAAMVWRRGTFAARLGIVTVCALAAGIMLTLHPYWTNLSGYGHPFWPLMGDGARDIMEVNTPEIFSGNDRVTDFFRSLFIPSVPSYDRREGGFTLLMPLLLICCVVVAVNLRRRLTPLFRLVAWTLFLSCFLFAQTWWARYIPQLWGVVVLFMLAAVAVPRTRRIGWLMAALMVIAGGTALVAGYTAAAVKGASIGKMLEESRISGTPVRIIGVMTPQAARHFDEAGVEYVSGEESDTVGGRGREYYRGCGPVIVVE